MNGTIIFGLALAPLFSAISKVESDRGATSDNVYQLRTIYVKDVNRIIGRKVYDVESAYTYTSAATQEKMMVVYWFHYGNQYVRETGKPVTYEVLARIHNGGPRGWAKVSTEGYWRRVKAVMDAEAAANR